ncbi:TetR/AcrR family transcriptional regulator [Oceanospirillum sanctuarii]|uniref:TetR/AcrR family transcriptional regulator n=1 Tax=Oceanospirillum sanctuarii TaxID=1434821 RepID=UPI000A3C856D|nr:TetR/AcrR family transcriptional regulator [Oceanospirillum sanctuarii]
MKLSDKKRLQILDAAEQLFYDFGVEQTSMDQLAQVAGVSKRTVYNHFANKEELFQAIMRRMFGQLSEGAAVVFDASQPISDQLSYIALCEAKLMSSQPFLRVAKIGFMQLLKDPMLAQTLTQEKIGCLSYLEPFLQAATDAGVLKVEDPLFASQQFVYQLKAFIFYPQLYQLAEVSEADRDRAIQETVAMFLARYQA